MDDFETLAKIVWDGYWDCEDCGNRIEPDGKCICGRNSPLVDAGMI